MRPLILCALLISSVHAKSPWSEKPFGVMLLAHNGGQDWTRALAAVQKALMSRYPVEIAYGDADPRNIQRALDRLAAKKVKKIVAVPLFVSSTSDILDQTNYVLGVRKDPSASFMNQTRSHWKILLLQRVKTKIPLVVTSALDDHPIVAEILLDRAKKLSKEPAKETVVLVGEYPADKLAPRIQAKGGFSSVTFAVIKEEPALERTQADQALHKTIKNLSLRGKVLVVPYALALSDIDRHVRSALQGLFFQWTGQALMPDDRITRWVEESVEKSSALPDMRAFLKDSGTMTSPPMILNAIPKLPPIRAEQGARNNHR